jgi:hypothetical protein
VNDRALAYLIVGELQRAERLFNNRISIARRLTPQLGHLPGALPALHRGLAQCPIEAGDKASGDRITAATENDGNLGGCGFGCERRGTPAGSKNYGHVAAHQLGSECR